jgi:hypothetical protein
MDGNGRALTRDAVLQAITLAKADDLASWRVVSTTGGEPTRGVAP